MRNPAWNTGMAGLNETAMIGVVMDDTFIDLGAADTALVVDDIVADEFTGTGYVRLTATARVERISDAWVLFLDDLTGTPLDDDRTGVYWAIDTGDDATSTLVYFDPDDGAAIDPYLPSYDDGLFDQPIEPIGGILTGLRSDVDALTGLPAPGDEADVLTVVDGVWAPAPSDGGGGGTVDPWGAVRSAPGLRGVTRDEIVSASELAASSLGQWLDGTAGRVAAPDGTIHLFSCDLDDTGNIVRTTVTGSGASQVITGDPTVIAITGEPAGATVLGGKVWVDYDTGTVVMVTHTNRNATHGDAAGNIWSCIGLLRIDDAWGEAPTSLYLGDVVTVGIDIGDPAVGPNTIGSFSSYVIWGAYLYAFHADQRADGTVIRQCVSRATTASIVAAAATDDVPTFDKWGGAGFTEDGLGGRASEVMGVNAGTGSVTHAEFLTVPALDGLIAIVTELVTDETGTNVGTRHRSLFAPAPEGPWLHTTEIEGIEAAAVRLYSTYFGPDPERPWEAGADGEVYAYELVQPTFGSWAGATVDYLTLAPTLALGRNLYTYDHVGFAATVTGVPGDYITLEQPIGTVNEAVVTGDRYLFLNVFDGAPAGVYVPTATEWVRVDQPPVGGVIVPSGSTSDADVRAAWLVFRVVTTNTFQPDATAVSMAYDNTDSGLTAATIQAAIDELAAASGGLAAIADQRILGNVSGGSAVPVPVTATQVRTLLGIDGTLDAAKPVSTAQAAALAVKASRFPTPTGRYTFGLGKGAASATSSAVLANRITAYLVFVEPRTIDRLAYHIITGVASATLRPGLYLADDGADGLPGTAFLTPGVTINAAATGHQETTVSQLGTGVLMWAVTQVGTVASATTRSVGTESYHDLGRAAGDSAAAVSLTATRADAALPGSLAGTSWSHVSTLPHGLLLRYS